MHMLMRPSDRSVEVRDAIERHMRAGGLIVTRLKECLHRRRDGGYENVDVEYAILPIEQVGGMTISESELLRALHELFGSGRISHVEFVRAQDSSEYDVVWAALDARTM